MNLCSDNHDEVCYEGRKCPACAVAEDLQDKIDDLRNEVSLLESKLEAQE